MKSALAIDGNSNASSPIHNPFGEQYANGGNGDRSQNMILRTKKGDRAVEIELPRDSQTMTDFTIPVSPAFRDTIPQRDPASDGAGADSGYAKLPATMADHEITRAFAQGTTGAQDGDRRAIEEGLGLMPTEDSIPDADQSYLGALDHVKALYRSGRYEAGLVEIDGLIRQYPTSPKLHVMRGTLLDRVGQSELAIKSWNQALRLEPKNTSLRRFIERREQKRSVASP
jgi:tetratricopeptide (TPR) repeat protein